jgi:hypothetical protein
VILAFWIGIYPKPLFTVLEQPVHQIVAQVNPGYYNTASIAKPEAAQPAAALAKPLVDSREPLTSATATVAKAPRSKKVALAFPAPALAQDVATLAGEKR